LRFRECAWFAGADGVDVFAGVDAQEIAFAYRGGLGQLHVAGLTQSVGNEPKLLHGHDVPPKGCHIALMVKRGEHGAGGAVG
jgi:hypothetical protein